MSFQTHSVVWPADYNWQQAPLNPNSFFNSRPANTSIWYPWFLSMWSIGLLNPNKKPITSVPMVTEEVEEVFISEPSKEALREVIGWREIDILYPSPSARQHAIRKKEFIPENNLPLGIQTYKERIFVSLPRWKDGVPITLGWVNKNEGYSPPIRPYPNWNWHYSNECRGLTSVFRMDVDECNRLWVLDSGVVDAENTVTQMCPAQLFVFELETDQLLWRYSIPKEYSPDSSLLSNIVVEVINGDCLDAYAYLADVFRYGLIVYSLKTDKSWRVTHSYFYPDPLASDYILDSIRFQWVDGLFGMALSPADVAGNRTLYFHPLSSYREFAVPTHVLRNSTIGFEINDYFEVVGEPRGDAVSHCTGSAIDNDGVLFYNLLTKSGIGCWNSRTKVYNQRTQGLLYQNNETLSFPNDIRVDLEPEQSVWILSNRLHRFLYSRLDPRDVNYRILTAKTRELVSRSVCEQGAYIPLIVDTGDRCPAAHKLP